MYDMATVMVAVITVGMAMVTMLIGYIIEAVFLSKIASKHGKSMLLAWIPVLNFFLIRDIANKKLRWQWILAFLAAALLGNSVVRWLGTQALLWSVMIWYWSAFGTIMEDDTDMGKGWLTLSIFFYPIKLYVMYKMANGEER